MLSKVLGELSNQKIVLVVDLVSLEKTFIEPGLNFFLANFETFS